MSTITKIPFGLGEPQVAGALAVFPVLGQEPRTSYRTLAQALALGAFVKEVSEDGSVGHVLLGNRTDEPILIYEGEEIEGARQNRSFEAHVLVPAGVELTLSVSCVERGRWDEHQRDAHFMSAPHTPDPELRRIKRTYANRAASRGKSPRADQGQVWNEVSTRLTEHGVPSPSAALSDVFRSKGPALDELRSEIRHRRDQLGVVVEISGHPVALDLTSRAEVFADLVPRLAAGYALQALHAPKKAPNGRAAYGFLTAALEAPRRWLPTRGMGDGFAISQPGIEGAGLAVGPELIALSAFPAGKR
jgi:hypothetical protein